MKKRLPQIILLTGSIMFASIILYNFSILNKLSQMEEAVGFTGIIFKSRGMILVVSILLILGGLLKVQSQYHIGIVNGVFLAPVIIAFGFTVFVPFILGIGYSFTDWNGISLNTFVGFKNYQEIFTSIDFLYSFGVTFAFTVINALIVNIVAFSMALLVTSNLKGSNIYRAAYFVPNLIGGIVLGYVWQFIFNKVFTQIFVDSDSMLASPKLAIAAIVIVSTWQYAGYIMMIFVTGLQSVPKSVIEAASVDGAKGVQRLLHIIMPMIANTFTVCTFLTITNSFKQFDLNFAITNGGPSTVVAGRAIHSTEFLALNIYKTAILDNEFALGQAKAVIFFIILASVSLTQVYFNSRKEVEL